jgi:hypothetical protein
VLPVSTYTTCEALFDALYVSDYDVRIAAAIDAGDTAEAGRLLAEAVTKARDREACRLALIRELQGALP